MKYSLKSEDAHFGFKNLNEPNREKTYLWKCAQGEVSDQSAYSRFLIRILTRRVLDSPGRKYLHVDNEVFVWPVRMRRLIWVFVGRTCPKVLFSRRGSCTYIGMLEYNQSNILQPSRTLNSQMDLSYCIQNCKRMSPDVHSCNCFQSLYRFVSLMENRMLQLEQNTKKWTVTSETYLRTYATSEDSDQTAHSRSLIRIFTGRISDTHRYSVLLCFFFFFSTRQRLSRLDGFESLFGADVRRYVYSRCGSNKPDINTVYKEKRKDCKIFYSKTCNVFFGSLSLKLLSVYFSSKMRRSIAVWFKVYRITWH